MIIAAEVEWILLTSEENIHSDTITVPEKHKVRIHGVMQIQLVQEISFQLRIDSTSTKHKKQLPRYYDSWPQWNDFFGYDYSKESIFVSRTFPVRYTNPNDFSIYMMKFNMPCKPKLAVDGGGPV